MILKIKVASILYHKFHLFPFKNRQWKHYCNENCYSTIFLHNLRSNFLCCVQVLHEVHPHLDIDSEALTYLEKLLYQLLHKICSTCPVQVQDVKGSFYCNNVYMFFIMFNKEC